MGEYGVMFWEQVLGYPPKGTQIIQSLLKMLWQQQHIKNLQYDKQQTTY